ncbi:aconitase family protein, partial [Escherichia coli]|uniref:aconitase family protein n=1 Tax=Escherichia coli TaxID=562 RepID=UPI0023B170F2
ENLLRWKDGNSVTEEDIHALAGWLKNAHADREIAYRPARLLMQDFTGVPAVVDLAAMREAVKRLGGDTAKVKPLSPVVLVIDHSVTVDRFGDVEALEEN